MDAVPDLDSISDEELRELIEQLTREERDVSYQRRLLHGRIDILRAELVVRLKRQVGEGGGVLNEIDVERLSEILARKVAPPTGGP